MSESKPIKICKEFKKAIYEIIIEFRKFGGPTDLLAYLETCKETESVFMDTEDLKVALRFAEVNHISPEICCAIMELSGLMKDRYDKETIGESEPTMPIHTFAKDLKDYPDEYTENYGHLIKEKK